jgi:DNA-binding transcriptional ArsR family regulator
VLESPERKGDVDLAAVGAALAEPARAKVLLALTDGRSLPASHLASEAGVAASTASHHLARLVDVGLITASRRGRHRYFALAGAHVAELIEAAARVAPAQRITSLRQGTRAYAVRYARRCYDHLAGRLGVHLADALSRDRILVLIDADCDRARGGSGVAADDNPGSWAVTDRGVARLTELGLEVEQGDVARGCLDWTEQRNHIAGPIGRALMARLLDLGWLKLDRRSRAVRVTEMGRTGFPELLGVELPVDP